MSNNYPFQPERVVPANNPSSAQPESKNSTPEYQPTPPPSSSAVPLDNMYSGGSRRLAPGTLLSDGGRYRIEHLVASGGMGAVYRAIDIRFNRPCAVKEMLDEFKNASEREQGVEWFTREATLLLDLNHQCIPRVRDFFAQGGRHYLVMDFIEGHTLAQIMETEGNVTGLNGARGISEERARSWLRQVCGVLSYLHRQDPAIIFRDLKPSNIMVTNRNEIKLIDFGIARPFQSQAQATVIMTLGYAPPEQLHGRPEPRSDLYALGATIYRLLTRHDPANNKPNIFAFPSIRSLRPDISSAFEAILMKALLPNVEHRWASADEMERAVINLPSITNGSQSGALFSQQGSSSPVHPVVALPVSHTPSIPVSDPHLAPMTDNVQISASTPSILPSTTGPAGPYIQDARGHLSANRINQAYEAVKYAHGVEPNNAIVHKLFGQIFARRTPPQPDLALQAYSRSLQLQANDAETHKLIGDVWLFLRQNPSQAIPAYVQSLRLAQNDLDAHDRLGQCYDKTNQVELALREYQEAVRLASQQPEVVRLRLYFALGQIAMRANRLPAAEHAFVQVLTLNPADHQSRFLLSQVYEREGKYEDAFRECGYVINGPMSNNPGVRQLYFHLKNRLGR